MCILISCESGGDRVPSQLVSPQLRTELDYEIKLPTRYSKPRRGKSVRATRNPSHRPGSLPPRLPRDEAARYVSRRMSQKLSAPLLEHEHALDLIDVTRSLHHRNLFSPLTHRWSAEHQQALIDEVYTPYRQRVSQTLERMFKHFSYVLHLSVRTFDAKDAKRKHRRADVGLLYDPSAVDEVDLCLDWVEEMFYEIEMLRVRRNYPRRGTTDSLVKSMRAEFTDEYYLGIEILLNRAWAGREITVRDEVIDQMCETLQTVMQIGQREAA